MDNRNEKKIIIYLIIISLVLIYFSFFFIHDIIDKGRINDTISGTITPPENEVLGESTDKNNNGKVDKDDKTDGENKPDEDDKTNEDNKPDDGYIVDNSNRFKVLQGEKEWSELKELDIFKNSYFEDKSIIAPGVQGSYNFTVENDTESQFNYDIIFTEENPYKINMVFKLKVNGEYVLGNEQKWVTAAELSRTNLWLGAKSKDLYTVEWKWQDADNDTKIGETEGAYYKMFIKALAEQIEE